MSKVDILNTRLLYCQKTKLMIKYKQAVFHGVLRTLDPKLMRGAESVVRTL